jgi:glycerophosphoryl diester phosphodiesterase
LTPAISRFDEGNVDDIKSEAAIYTYEQQAQLSAAMQKKARNLTSSQHMPTFLELAQKFATDPKYRNIGLMIDIKMTNEPWIVRKIVEILAQVNPDLAGYWAPRTVLGIWRLDVLQEAGVVARHFSIVHIGVSRSLARRFIAMPQVCAVSLHHIALSAGAGGEAFIQEMKSQGRYVYTWTVNSLELMKWAVASDLDGVITDYPDIYAQLRAGLTDDLIKRNYAPATAARAFIPWIDRNVKNIFFYYLIELLMLGKMSLLYFTSGRKDN